MTESDIRAIMVALAEIRGDVKALRTDNDKADRIHADFEVRIRGMERFRWLVAGAFGVAGSGVGAVIAQLIK